MQEYIIHIYVCIIRSNVQHFSDYLNQDFFFFFLFVLNCQ